MGSNVREGKIIGKREGWELLVGRRGEVTQNGNGSGHNLSSLVKYDDQVGIISDVLGNNLRNRGGGHQGAGDSELSPGWRKWCAGDRHLW
jgi:hypothetical protein